MEVSTFEILYKPLTPPLEAGTEAIARRVLQGYFLTVSNLNEDQGYVFQIEFRITLPDPFGASRTLADGNAVLITDIGGPGNDALGEGNNLVPMLTNSPSGSNRFIGTFFVPAGFTALVVLLPNVAATGFFVSGPQDIEIRGNVSLVLPCVSLPVGIGPAGFYRKQSGAPARVLLNAEHRATYLPPGWPANAVGDLDFDQTGTAVALASGKALNEVESVPSCFLKVPFDLDDVLRRLPLMAPPADPAGLAGDLIGGLARLDPDKKNLDTMSALLEKAGVPIRLTPTKKG